MFFVKLDYKRQTPKKGDNSKRYLVKRNFYSSRLLYISCIFVVITSHVRSVNRFFQQEKSNGKFVFLQDTSSNGTLVNNDIVGKFSMTINRSVFYGASP